MKRFIKILLILVVIYLLIGLGLYFTADVGVRGNLDWNWLLFWPGALLFYSHVS